MAPLKFTENDVARFWSKVDKRSEDECWEWTGGKTSAGYGVFHLRRKVVVLSHRASIEMATGEFPGSLHVCHTCDNPPCVNPAHLFLGTATDNMRDAKAKGRLSMPPRNSDVLRTLTMEQATEIRSRYHLGESMPKLANAFGMTWASIRAIVDNESYKDPLYRRSRFRDRRPSRKH